MTASGISSRSVAERFGFQFCTGDEDDILKNENINTLFIATRHNSHAEFVLKGLKVGKHVFVEKPLCLNVKELEEIKLATDGHRRTPEEYAAHSTGQAQMGGEEFCPADGGQAKTSVALRGYGISTQPILMVGYNRRFAPLLNCSKKSWARVPWL
jgi:hypothetical protein